MLLAQMLSLFNDVTFKYQCLTVLDNYVTLYYDMTKHLKLKSIIRDMIETDFKHHQYFNIIIVELE